MQKWLAKTISCKNNFDVKAGKAKLFCTWKTIYFDV